MSDNESPQIEDSHDLLAFVPIGHIMIPEPRLVGCNPSLEILARITFKLSNKLWIDWTGDDSSWFLNWFGVSADLKMLRSFFSVKTPTVWAVYESLCDVARNLKRSAAARVLFEILGTVRSNNPVVGDGPNFLEIAVNLGSRTDGMVEVATRALALHDPAHRNTEFTRRQRLPLLVMVAAARRDLAMLRLLVDAGTQAHNPTTFGSNDGPMLLVLIIRQLCALCDEDNGTLADYTALLIRGGILTTSISTRCCYLDRPAVEVCRPRTLTIDELIMICPSKARPRLFGVVSQFSSEHRSFISNAGVFAAACRGVRSLDAYLQSCRRNNDFEIHETLQESMLFAASLNDTETASALLQLGVDPETSLLSHNQMRYHKGDVSWNPMVAAATAGNLETLRVLKGKANLRQFLTLAPIHEIVQLEDAQIKCGNTSAQEPLRLDLLRRHYIYSQTKEPDINVASDTVFIEPFLGVGTLIFQGSPSGNGVMVRSVLSSIEKTRLDTLGLIRNIAIAHGVGDIIDKEIIEAALSNDPESRTMQCRNAAYHPCDALLLDGLVDANIGHHEGGMDLLQLSIRNQCSLEVVEFLMSKGLKVHSRPAASSGNTMLHDALLGQSPDRSEIVELLLREGVDYKHCEDGFTILEASLYGKDFRTEEGTFPEYLDIFQRLLDAGAPVRRRLRPQLKKWRPLLCLLLDADAEDDLILRVVDAGADLNQQVWDLDREDNRTPLQKAVSDGRDTLAQELIRRGANVHAPAGQFRGYTVLQAACKFDHTLQFIKYLVEEQGANVNETPARITGMSALQWAAFRGSLSLAEFLLDHGADVNGLSGYVSMLHGEHQIVRRRRALDHATLAGRLDMVEFLLKAGGRSGRAGVDGAIDAAETNGHFAVLSVLLERKRTHGKRMVEEEAEWQRRHPDAARLFSDP